MAEDIQADLEFYKNFRISKGDISEKKLREKQRLDADSAEFRVITMRLAWDKKRQIEQERTRQQLFSEVKKPVPVENPRPKPKESDGYGWEILAWYKKMDNIAALAYDRLRLLKLQAMTEGRLDWKKNELLVSDTKPDKLRLQTNFPERFSGVTVDNENNMWNVNLQSALGTEKDQRSVLKIGDSQFTELQAVWFTNKDLDPPKAIRYVLADSGDWYKSTANSFTNDKNQNIDFWNLGEYQKLDSDRVDVIHEEMSRIQSGSQLKVA